MRKFETVDEVKSVTAHEVINSNALQGNPSLSEREARPVRRIYERTDLCRIEKHFTGGGRKEGAPGKKNGQTPGDAHVVAAGKGDSKAWIK
nr:hypothetical protein [uncultured Acetatifactor sp.]